jgi:hypothetical protein
MLMPRLLIKGYEGREGTKKIIFIDHPARVVLTD